MRYLLLIFFGFFFVSFANAQEKQTISLKGTIFLDKNKNGLQDHFEPGLKSVPVSNGREIVYTDKKGRFTLEAKVGQSIFPISPKGHRLLKDNKKAVSNADFWYIDPSRIYPADTVINFPMIAVKQSPDFRIGAIGDIQTENMEELGYAGKSIFNELVQRPDIDFHIFLGDLFNDDLSILPAMSNMIKTLPSPVWAVPGNHDRNMDNPEHMDDLFNRDYGAGTFAFNYDNVHFLVFNNVYATGKRSYEGRYNEDQLAFLANDLKNIRPDQLVVISQHIPMMNTENKEAIFALLKPYSRVLILSGHTHRVGRHFYEGGRIQELVTGAACGMWWTGEKDFFGVPQALMQCGSPRNYFTVDFRKEDYSLHFKAIGYEDNYQMDISVDSNQVIANIFGGSDSTEVWMQIDDQDWVTMVNNKMIAPKVADLLAKNNAKIYPTKGNRLNPMRKAASPHIWTAPFLNPKENQIHTIRIRAKDKYGFEAEGFSYFFSSK